MAKESFSQITEYAKNRLSPLIPFGMLGLSQLACNVIETVTSPDPIASFARGAIGMFAIELELGAGKRINHVLFETTNPPAGCLSLLLLGALPVATGVMSIEYPAVGYFASAIPVFAAISYVFQKIHDAKE